MSEPNTRPAEDPNTEPPPVLEANEGSDPGVSEDPKGSAEYDAYGQVEEEPAESSRS